MTNVLVGDVYQKIIESVIAESKSEFEESGVSVTVLSELQQEWQQKLSARQVAQMPWEPKQTPMPAQPPPNPASSLPSAATNGLPPSYGYDGQGMNGGARIKAEPGTDAQYQGGLPNGYQQQQQPTQGGYARAQQLVQAHQAQRGGLALPGQRQQAPQGLQLPGQTPQQQQYAQHQFMQQRQQQAALQQQQGQPRIKVENDSPQMQQGGFQQQPRQPNSAYAQTDGADEGLEEWQAMVAQRRAVAAEQTQRADRMIRDHVLQSSSDLQSGLMMPLGERPKPAKGKGKQRRVPFPPAQTSSILDGPSVPQLDGDVDEDEKHIKDEEDENAINSDLDDSDEGPEAGLGDDEDEFGDSILCTYDKVQRVKNKWKCTLKDGVLSVKGKEWVFHKGMGEFEW